MRIIAHSIGKIFGETQVMDVSSMAHSNITILEARDSISRKSWTHEITHVDSESTMDRFPIDGTVRDVRFGGLFPVGRRLIAKFGDFWKYRADYFFNTLLYCLNIGNLWRFPTQAIKYGEGAFIYVYIVFTLIFGIPMLFFEFSVGQYTDRGVRFVFRIVPFFEGLSSAMGFFSNTIVHVYGLISIYNFIYFFSFVRTNAPLSDATKYEKMCSHENRTNTLENLHFLNEVVMISDDSMCTFNVRNMFITIVMWLAIWAYITKEYATSSKNYLKIYFFIISALVFTLIAALTVEGAASGIVRMLTPPLKNFASYKVYIRAFEQSMITLGLGMGPLINFGARTFFRTPIHIHAIVLVVITLLASLVMVMIVFGAVGVYTTEQGFSNAVFSEQEYYMHVLLSKLFTKMAFGLKHITIVMFYGAFFTAGMYSSVQYTKLMVDFIRSKCYINPQYYSGIILLFCFCQSLISFVMISNHGINLLYWGATNIFTTFSVLTLVLLESVAFFFLYGMRNFCEDIVFMVGYKPTLWNKIIWYLSTVLCMLVLLGTCYEIATSDFGWYEGFSVFTYLIVVVIPICIPAVQLIITSIKAGKLSSIFRPQEIQTVFQDYGNWTDNLSNNS